MKVIIHSITVAEEYNQNSGWILINSNIRSWHPDEMNKFCISLIIDLGEKGKSKSQGSDEFYLKVASPSGLAILKGDNAIISDSPLLVIKEYDWSVIWNNVEEKVSVCDAESWNACGEWLSRYFRWEFDNYKEH